MSLTGKEREVKERLMGAGRKEERNGEEKTKAKLADGSKCGKGEETRGRNLKH